MSNYKEKYLVVDGYNIINSWDDLNELKNLSLDDAREKLIDYMSEFRSLSDEKIIVVFDSYKKEGSVRTIIKRKGIEVVYTEEDELADNYIEKLVSNKKKYQEYRVASSDSIIQSIILGRGATRISANELLLEYNQKKSSTLRRNKKQYSKRNKNIVQLDDEQIKKLEKFERILKEDK